MTIAAQYRLPRERPFAQSERGQVTIILGGLTWKHERLLAAVLERNGYRAECLPLTEREAHEIGKEYCANGLCNPVYFQAGSLIRRLREIEQSSGLTRAQIVERYLFLTAGSCGPCRFGMYEAELRTALRGAGFDGFRVVLFSQDDGIKASSGQAGLVFSVDFGMAAFSAFVLGDILNDLHRRIRAYAVTTAAADAKIEELVQQLETYFRTEPYFDLARNAPRWLRGWLQRHREAKLFRWTNSWAKVATHLRAHPLRRALATCRQSLAQLELNRLQVKPRVHVIGEFWAQLTEGDGNFRMFDFLEREGAEVGVETISGWIMYLLFQSRQKLRLQRRLADHQPRGERRRRRLSLWAKDKMFAAGEWLYLRHYAKLERALGNLTGGLHDQQEMATLAEPYYNTRLRGGEGHMEVAKNLYYTKHHESHMVLALKPFGCLPSTQSDAVQAMLVEHFPEMIFVSIETAGDGAIHAYSRAQMVLADAKQRARREFAALLRKKHISLAKLQSYVAAHAELRHAAYRVGRHTGVTSTAANFALDVLERMAAEDGARQPHRRKTGQPSLAGLPRHEES